MEIKVRDICPACNGTGKAMTDDEAIHRASRHNDAARHCHSPNYLSAKDFVVCCTCQGEGKAEKWVPAEEVLAVPDNSN